MRLSFIFVIAAVSLLPAMLFAQSNEDALTFDGDMLVRGFYVYRDLPLERVTKQPCPNPFEKGVPGTVQSPCREKGDFYTARFRMNLTFRPNAYVDIYYGLEVGDITFGKDVTPPIGPSTGGKGSGAVNVETREMRMRVHDKDRTQYVEGGIFPLGSPSGLVMATSGAGFKGETEARSLMSNFLLAYLRQVDDSIHDGDLNGYSDKTFKDVNLLYGSWKFYGFQDWNIENYFVYRHDPSEYDENRVTKDTHRLYWLGSQVRYTKGAFGMLIHGVGNAGLISSVDDPELTDRQNKFHQPTYDNYGNVVWLQVSAVDRRKQISPVHDAVLSATEEARSAFPDSRKRYPIRSAAGQVEFSYRILDATTLAIGAAAATGRLRAEADGRSIKLRKDQFYTANPAFQYSEIALDTSGGYTIFANGELAGLQAYQLQWRQKFTSSIEGKFSYTYLKSNWSYDGTFNQFYGWWKGAPSSDIGNELNAVVDWRPFAQFLITGKLAIFIPGRGYRFLQDAEHGSLIREYSIYVMQRF
ncbi:MAG: hypothetical protein H3C43_06915 [Leptonema sp. (in: Bacteria)]|nr:hypothetical protein [Leptonema sp. (in: bacteria)]